MIKFATIGTHWITKQFIEAAQQVGWQLTAVYSRQQASAQKFADQFIGPIKTFTELDEFLASQDFSVVYLASPNSLHFEQSQQALLAGKHVIVEKPACSNPTEMKQIIKILRQHPELYYFEAARHFHEPLFQQVKQAIKQLSVIQGAHLTYEKYSSRYDAFLAGQEPNIFSLEFSGGALQDLGVYLVYAAIAWFGYPQSADYRPQKLRNGIDGRGIAILEYPRFQVILKFGKTTNSYLASEIYGLKQTLILDSPAKLNELKMADEQGNVQSLARTTTENPMLAEVKDFDQLLNNPASLIAKQKMEDWLALAVQVNQLMYQLRQSAKLSFPADEKYI
ncbi:Gfo/Idh/MocA family protein [Liquorilactobacillus vini]|uniref:Gfo/Idh/MocA family protein n=1 Tax=Liquorilactobacillus vini TaxID=238015 RepID=UPI000302D859|nr:Gfo/Idh/MocA family oxidoreductase [Liquorilactobacillus vini]